MLTQTLQEMVSNLRSECGHSLNIAQGVNAVNTLQYLLRRTQEELWQGFVWPELSVRVDIPTTPGTYLYNYSALMSFDMIREVWAGNGSGAANTSFRWTRVDYGIDENRRTVAFPSVNSSTGDPVQFWESENPSTGAPQFRIWPTPQTAGYVRMKGNRALKPLIANSDISSLDATCIILFAAAEQLTRAKADDAQSKTQKAQRHLNKLLGNQVSAKNKISTVGSQAPRLVTSR